VRLLKESSFVDGDKLVVSYNSVAFLDEGDGGAALGGNNPIEADLNSGACRFISMMEALDYMDRGLIQ
jgi:hypothetical protein